MFIATFNNRVSRLLTKWNSAVSVKTRRSRVDKRRLDARDSFIESMKLLVLITRESMGKAFSFLFFLSHRDLTRLAVSFLSFFLFTIQQLPRRIIIPTRFCLVYAWKWRFDGNVDLHIGERDVIRFETRGVNCTQMYKFRGRNFILFDVESSNSDEFDDRVLSISLQNSNNCRVPWLNN